MTSETAQRGITPHSPRRQSLPQLKSQFGTPQFAAKSGGPLIRRSISVGQSHVDHVPESSERNSMVRLLGIEGCWSFGSNILSSANVSVSYTHLTLPTTPYV